MYEAWIWQYIFLGEGGEGRRGGGGSRDADIILGGVATLWWCLIKKGGGENLGKGDYVISEHSLTM